MSELVGKTDPGITAVPGISVGHAGDREAATGCTVVLCPQGAAAGVDVRGGAPGTRETDCLDPSNLVEQVHGVYLGGGSAYGLDGAAGVMRWLEEQGAGFAAGVGRVPIVPGAVIFDLLLGSHTRRPDAAMGYRACQAATVGPTPRGTVGAGTGATVGKAAGPERCMKGGVGSASLTAAGLVVGALVVVNCFGDVLDPDTGTVLAGTLTPERRSLAGSMEILAAGEGPSLDFGGNTTIGVVAVSAALSKAQARRVAIMAHDGYARAINPVHTPFDGDTIFCLATGKPRGEAADLTRVGALAAAVMARAVADAVRSATGLHGVPAHRDLFGEEA